MSGMYICFISDGCGYYIKNKKNKKTASFAECYYTDTRQSNHFSIFWKKGFAECNYFDTRRSLKLCRVPDAWHSAHIQISPSADLAALGKARNFAECCQLGTRRSLNLCRVPRVWHSAKFSTPFRSAVPFVPFARSVRQFAVVRPVSTFFCRVRLGTRQRFAECPRKVTRQSRLRR